MQDLTKIFCREKKRKRLAGFDVVERVHEPEYATLKAENPLEPAHKFEIRLEENTFTQEKYYPMKSFAL